MSKAFYTGVSGVARKNKSAYIGVSSVARKVKSGYVGVSGVARKFFAGETIGDLPIGSIVKVNEQGSLVDFILVHKGNPNADFYSNLSDAVWLLRKNVYNKRSGVSWDSEGDSDTHYINMQADDWCQNTYYKYYLSSSVQSCIETIYLPYMVTGANGKYTWYSGTSGAKRQVFLLSSGNYGVSSYDSGTGLDYFSSNSARIAKTDTGTDGVYYWTCMQYDTYGKFDCITPSGTVTGKWSYDYAYYRPAFIVSSSTDITLLQK